MGFLTSEYTWVTTALLVFFGILYYAGVHRTVLGALDGRGKRIAAELNEARRLREEAQALLNSFEGKRKAAEAEAAELLASAAAEARRIEAEGQARVEAFVKRRTAQAEIKIAQAEASATAEVRAAAADAAVAAAERLLRAAPAATTQGLFDAALSDVRAKLN